MLFKHPIDKLKFDEGERLYEKTYVDSFFNDFNHISIIFIV